MDVEAVVTELQQAGFSAQLVDDGHGVNVPFVPVETVPELADKERLLAWISKSPYGCSVWAEGVILEPTFPPGVMLREQRGDDDATEEPQDAGDEVVKEPSPASRLELNVEEVREQDDKFEKLLQELDRPGRRQAIVERGVAELEAGLRELDGSIVAVRLGKAVYVLAIDDTADRLAFVVEADDLLNVIVNEQEPIDVEEEHAADAE